MKITKVRKRTVRTAGMARKLHLPCDWRSASACEDDRSELKDWLLGLSVSLLLLHDQEQAIRAAAL